MRSSLSFLRSLSLSLSHRQPHHFHRHFFFRAISTPLSSSSPKPQKYFLRLAAASASSSHSTFVEHLACEPETNENWDFNNSSESEAAFDFDKNDGSLDLKHLPALSLDVKELEELPEQWRRSKLAWLCKELPAHKAGTLVRILNAQKKWMRQADATYVAVHCLRIRENEAGFKTNAMEFQRNVIDVAENNDGEKNENVIDVDGDNDEGENIENVTFVESGEIRIGMQVKKKHITCIMNTL